MPLSMLLPGQEGTIRHIAGEAGVRAHLARLGFVTGQVVRVVSALGGDVILQVKDSRIALSKAMANRIMI